MLRRYHFLAPTLSCLVLACVSSLQPWYTDEDLVFEERLLGRWIDQDDSGDVWLFAASADSSYRLTFTPGEYEGLSDKAGPGKPRDFSVHLFRLGELLLLDMFPEEIEAQNDLYGYHLQGIHTLWKVALEADRLQLAFLDDEWLSDEVESGELTVEHKIIEDRMILTASTGDLQKLIRTVASRVGAFSEPSSLTRAPNTPALQPKETL